MTAGNTQKCEWMSKCPKAAAATTAASNSPSLSRCKSLLVKEQLAQSECQHEPIILQLKRLSEAMFHGCISCISMHTSPAAGLCVRVGAEGLGRARTAGLHTTTDDMPAVLVGDLNVEVWLNVPGPLYSLTEQLGSGLVRYAVRCLQWERELQSHVVC